MIALTSNLRTATAAPATAGRLARAGQAVWRALEAVGQQRSAAYLHNLADTYADTRPEFARRMRAAANGQHFD